MLQSSTLSYFTASKFSLVRNAAPHASLIRF